jgi:predicted nucleic acid-binding protein
LPKNVSKPSSPELQRTETQIVVATPALSEIMIRSGVAAVQQYISLMTRTRVFKISSFDIRAAMEVAIMQGHVVAGERGKSATAATHAKLKYDRQIVAIAKVEGAQTLYTDDKDQRSFPERHGLAVRGLADLPIPASTAQRELFGALGPDTDNTV